MCLQDPAGYFRLQKSLIAEGEGWISKASTMRSALCGQNLKDTPVSHLVTQRHATANAGDMCYVFGLVGLFCHLIHLNVPA